MAFPGGVWGTIAPRPLFCQSGGRDFLKIDEKIGGGWGGLVAKLSENFWKMIDQHQYRQALCVLNKQEGLVC